MKQRLSGVVTTILEERPGAQEVEVRVDTDPDPSSQASSSVRQALNLVTLTGRLEPGQRVLLNTLAVEMGLGTGDLDFIIAALDQPASDFQPPGHILKLRYTPLQMSVLAVEAPESPHHDAIRLFASLDDTPVVCLGLHSQLPAICAAAHWSAKTQGCDRLPGIVYVMTDGASLPLSLSRLAPKLKTMGWLKATVTTGQAFGGDYEAVNLYSGLAAAKTVANADIIVVGQGPGNVGTATPLGFSGIDQGLAVNAASSLGGVPIVVSRISFTDERARHQCLSHHTLTVLRHVVRAPALLPLPRLPKFQRHALEECLRTSGVEEMHETIYIDAEKGLKALIDSGLEVTTMGRNPSQERPFFLAAAAAGLLAAQLVESRLSGDKPAG